jgi:hypothetical protein
MYWTDRSLEYATELDDRRVVSYVLMRKSNIATESGQPGHGLGLPTTRGGSKIILVRNPADALPAIGRVLGDSAPEPQP